MQVISSSAYTFFIFAHSTCNVDNEDRIKAQICIFLIYDFGCRTVSFLNQFE